MSDLETDDRIRERFASLPVSRESADAFGAVVGHRRRLRRDRVVARAAVLALAATVVASAVVFATRDERTPVVTHPGPVVTQGIAANPFVELLTIGREDGPRIIDPATGNRSKIGPDLRCMCLIVRAADQLFTAYEGRLYAFASGDGALRDIGAVDDLSGLSPSADRESLYLSTGSRIEQRSVDGAVIGGPWTLPDGYELTEQPHAVSRGFVVSKKTEFIGDLAWWDRSTGEVHQLGRFQQFVDAYTDDQGRDTLAWTMCDGGGFPCSLVLGDLDGARHIIGSPKGANGFLLGGAFSPDGTAMATSVLTNDGVHNPMAGLALVSVATRKASVVEGSAFRVGEPFGYVSWAPNGDAVYFGGLDNGMREYDLRSRQVTHPDTRDDYYAVGVLPAPDRRRQCPGTEHAWQRGPIFESEGGDGLPKSGQANADAARTVRRDAAMQYYNATRAYVRAEPGHVWKADGARIEQETIYTLVLEVPSKRDCPKTGPPFWDDVPLTIVYAAK